MANVTNILQSSIDLEHIKKCFPDESQHQTIKLIIDECLAAGINLQNQIAYVLATAKGESGFKLDEESFAYSKKALQDKWGKTRFSDKWIEENITFKKNSKGKLVVVKEDWEDVANRAYSGKLDNGDDASGDGYKYRGRGFVQLTGKANYEKFGNIIGEDLLSNPDRVLEPNIAAKIIAFGMKNGTFTAGDSGISGTNLSKYLTLKKEDYSNARRIINGTDKASTFAAYAADYESIIEDCLGQDIAFVVDTTGSMADDIDEVKASSTKIINSLFDSSHNSRVAVVGYNDPGTNTFLSFTDQPEINDRKSAALSAINSISVGGGGDLPEVVNAGLIRALSGGAGQWRKEVGVRRIILFGDAPPKDTELRSQVLQLAKNLDVSIESSSLLSFAISSDIETQKVTENVTVTDFMVSAETLEATPVEFPVQIFTILVGNDPEAAADFNSLAAETGGETFTAKDAENVVSVLLQAIDESTQSPVAVEDTISTNAVTVITVDLLGNDSDPNGDSLAITEIEDEPVMVGQQITLSSGALVTFNADSSISYNPNGKFDLDLLEGEDIATDSFTYTISDGTGRISSAIVSVEINKINSTLSLTKIGDDVFTLTGSNAKLQVTLVESKSSLVNELAVFTVDDAQGKINGIAPGETGYTQAALNKSKVIFSTIANVPNGFDINNLTSLIEFESGNNLRFLLVKNGTIDSVQNGNTPTSDILFSDLSRQKITDLGTDGFSLAWKDGSNNNTDFKDLVVNIKSTNDPLPLGTNLQGKQQGEVLDLRGITQDVKADFVVNREAAFNNFVGFYKVADENGGIDVDADGTIDFRPGDSGYAQAAIKNRVAGIDLRVDNQGTASFTDKTLTGGSIFAPFILTNGRTVDQVLNGQVDQAYFGYLGANADKVDHIRLLGNNVFGFEDLAGGGDKDYNDVVLKVNLSVV